MPGHSHNISALPSPALRPPDPAPPMPEARALPSTPPVKTAGPSHRTSALRRNRAWCAVFAVLLPAGVLPTHSREPTPLRVIGLFDSLLQAGNLPAARALCAGQVLRMFDFLALAQGKMAGLVDSARSREDTLQDSIAGDWAFVKIASRVVFKQPFLGQEEMRSVQAIHLWKSPRGWLLAEFQELEDAKQVVRFRTGRPALDPPPRSDIEVRARVRPPLDSGPYETLVPLDPKPDPDPGFMQPSPEPQSGIFPVSRRAPETPGEADRLRYILRLRNGRALAGLVALDAYQSLVKAKDSSTWILESRKPGPKDLAKAKARTKTGSARPDSLARYLASNPYLILEDSLLQAAARKAVGGEKDPVRKTAAIRKWVTEGFDFKLGTVLFGNSRAAILAAALLRASGVPSRVALGFASAGGGVFIGHAWTEAWLGPGPGWVGVDAALGQFPAGVERVKLLTLDGRADMRIAATNLMLDALYNIDIDILQAWKGEKLLTLKAFPGAAEEGERFFSEILKGFGGK
jgi:transglutaminase-like putative cysteine protease